MRDKSLVLIQNIKGIYGISDEKPVFKRGEDMSRLEFLKGAYLLIEDGLIKDFGPNSKAPDRASTILDAKNGFVFPCWCDSHTHIVFAKSRETEFVDRIRGLSYEEIAAKGGGILNSAMVLRKTSEAELFESAMSRINEMLKCGTGAVEIKSGYGLSLESELKMLRVIKSIKENCDLEIKSTFLGAHSIPSEYKENREKYIDIIIHEMIPAVADEGLADYCDVFCDRGFFSVEETERILKTSQIFGLKAKIHANELANSGGVQAGIRNQAVSVDHLERIGQEEIDLLNSSETIPTLLPAVSFFLNMPYAQARNMIDQGLGVALASDYNPGSSPTGNMPFILSLACIKMGLLPEEAFNAATINGAFAMGIQDSHGSISVGKVASIIVTKEMNSISCIPYFFGHSVIDKVFIRGKLKYSA